MLKATVHCDRDGVSHSHTVNFSEVPVADSSYERTAQRSVEASGKRAVLHESAAILQHEWISWLDLEDDLSHKVIIM